MLKELVGDFCTGNDGPYGEAFLGMKQNVADQEGFSGILLADDDNHGRLARVERAPLLDDIHVEFSNVEVHIAYLVDIVFFAH